MDQIFNGKEKQEQDSTLTTFLESEGLSKLSRFFDNIYLGNDSIIAPYTGYLKFGDKNSDINSYVIEPISPVKPPVYHIFGCPLNIGKDKLFTLAIFFWIGEPDFSDYNSTWL